jgi:flagellar hook-length control protein FliK
LPATPPVPVVANVPMGAVPVEIGLKSLAGINRFEIRLDPEELGRIDVRLEIAESGEVKARLTVERVETLALLQRDARTLERAFEQAGFKAGEGALDMQLRDPGGGRGENGRGDGSRGEPGRDGRAARGPEQPPQSPPPQARPIWRGAVGIDVRI